MQHATLADEMHLVATDVAGPLLSLLTFPSKFSFSVDGYKGKTVLRCFKLLKALGKKLL